VGGERAPGFSPGPDIHLVALGTPAAPVDTSVTGPLGAQFLVWEYAVAVAGRLLGINPFDQPNVAESKENTARLLAEAGEEPLPAGTPAFTDGAVDVFAEPGLLPASGGLAEVLDALLIGLPGRGYLAIMAYLDRDSDRSAAGLRDALAARTTHPVTFGWGPRFLHSTGQYHKGGPQDGVFLQITGAVQRDIQVPGRDFTLGRLQLAQALGDLGALRQRGRPAVRMHLRDRAAGLSQLLDAARASMDGAAR
jgi:glucose-6-phosphate isomerase